MFPYQFAFSLSMHESSCGSASLPELGAVSVLDLGYSKTQVVMCHCLISISLMSRNVEQLFMYLLTICVLWGDVFSVFWPIFKNCIVFLLLSFNNSLRILNNCPLPDIIFFK